MPDPCGNWMKVLATYHVFTWKDGVGLIGFGTACLLLSILELMQSKRTSASIIYRIWAWGCRLFAILTWFLMIFAGITFVIGR